MDVHFLYAGQRFRWDVEKAHSNIAKHGVRFEKACEIFADPFVHLLDASPEEEARGSGSWNDRGLDVALRSPRRPGEWDHSNDFRQARHARGTEDL